MNDFKKEIELTDDEIEAFRFFLHRNTRIYFRKVIDWNKCIDSCSNSLVKDEIFKTSREDFILQSAIDKMCDFLID